MAIGQKAGRRLNELRERFWKRCAGKWCRKEFKGLKVQIYCSNKCRQRAAYYRRKEENGK